MFVWKWKKHVTPGMRMTFSHLSEYSLLFTVVKYKFRMWPCRYICVPIFLDLRRNVRAQHISSFGFCRIGVLFSYFFLFTVMNVSISLQRRSSSPVRVMDSELGFLTAEFHYHILSHCLS